MDTLEGIGLIIGALGVAAAFGQWLFPREPRSTTPPSSPSLTNQKPSEILGMAILIALSGLFNIFFLREAPNFIAHLANIFYFFFGFREIYVAATLLFPDKFPKQLTPHDLKLMAVIEMGSILKVSAQPLSLFSVISGIASLIILNSPEVNNYLTRVSSSHNTNTSHSANSQSTSSHSTSNNSGTSHHNNISRVEIVKISVFIIFIIYIIVLLYV